MKPIEHQTFYDCDLTVNLRFIVYIYIYMIIIKCQLHHLSDKLQILHIGNL